MMQDSSSRYRRLHSTGEKEDQRNPAQRDRDRLIHSSALRRLAGVTQVVDPAEGYVFHNRLTHTLKVAQIARRLAEKLQNEQPGAAYLWGGLDPEVVETAALAHDLGHPPFGHIAETKLDDLVCQAQDTDGFEGNAQSFRIVNKLAVRREDVPGINLTQASLNAILKYPWIRQEEEEGYRHEKWGAYRLEEDELEFARERHEKGDLRRSVEAEIMDWSDDIAYAVHDMEDFYRAGLVPLHLLIQYQDERERFLQRNESELEQRAELKGHGVNDLKEAFHNLLRLLPITEAYEGTRRQRAALRTCTGYLIGQYVFGISLRDENDGESRAVEIFPRYEQEIFLLKRLTRYYVIDAPKLATQQYGKARVIEGLFDTFMDAATGSKRKWEAILPVRCREEIERFREDGNEAPLPRLVADVISSLSDREALTLHRRLVGTEPGSALDQMLV